MDVEAVVLGPAAGAPENVVAVSSGSAPLHRRLLAMARATRRDTDVLDVHFALYGLVPALLPRRRRPPLVVHFHGPWSDESRSQGTSAPAAAWVKKRVERAVYRRACETVTLSAAFRRMLVERYSVSPWRVTVIPPGVDTNRFRPGNRSEARARLGLPDGAWIVASVRRLVPRMGLDVLLDAWADAGARGDALLVIGGSGPEQARLEAIVEARGIRESVQLRGAIPEEELSDFYRAADLTVVPSRSLEGFGLVALESLACGTPVVVSDAGGLPEAVAGLTPSLIAPAGDGGALAERLNEARAGAVPTRRECRDHAKRFSWKDAAAEHIAVYGRARIEPDRARRPRVAYLTHTARLSGAELALLRVLPALAADVEPHVIVAEDGPLVPLLLEAGISVEVLRMQERARGVRRDAVGLAALPATAAYTIRLARRLHELRPELVHANSLKAGLYGSAAARLSRIPAVWHVHDRIATDYLPPRMVALVQAAVRALPAAVVANSRATLETLPGVERAFVIPNAVNIDVPLEENAGREPEALRFGMVGRIAPWKGQHVFIEAFARAFPTGEERAVIVGAPMFGADEEEYLAHLRELGEQLRLDGRLVFAGFKDDVAAELSRLDVLVHASVTPEPFGQVVVEGMAAGLPVVASAAGGPRELIRDGVDGFLVEPGDSGALAGILSQLVGDPALRARLGLAARTAAARYSPKVVAAQVLDVYQGLLVGS